LLILSLRGLFLLRQFGVDLDCDLKLRLIVSTLDAQSETRYEEEQKLTAASSLR
jgi:hypothetical protein